MHLLEAGVSLLKKLMTVLPSWFYKHSLPLGPKIDPLGIGSAGTENRAPRTTVGCCENSRGCFLRLCLAKGPLDHVLDLIQIERLVHISKRAQIYQVLGILFGALT